jgi:hypothetical protein
MSKPILRVFATNTDWLGEDIFIGDFESLSEIYDTLSGSTYQEYLIYEISDNRMSIIEKRRIDEI